MTLPAALRIQKAYVENGLLRASFVGKPEGRLILEQTFTGCEAGYVSARGSVLVFGTVKTTYDDLSVEQSTTVTEVPVKLYPTKIPCLGTMVGQIEPDWQLWPATDITVHSGGYEPQYIVSNNSDVVCQVIPNPDGGVVDAAFVFTREGDVVELELDVSDPLDPLDRLDFLPQVVTTEWLFMSVVKQYDVSDRRIVVRKYNIVTGTLAGECVAATNYGRNRVVKVGTVYYILSPTGLGEINQRTLDTPSMTAGATAVISSNIDSNGLNFSIVRPLGSAWGILASPTSGVDLPASLEYGTGTLGDGTTVTVDDMFPAVDALRIEYPTDTDDPDAGYEGAILQAGAVYILSTDTFYGS